MHSETQARLSRVLCLLVDVQGPQQDPRGASADALLADDAPEAILLYVAAARLVLWEELAVGELIDGRQQVAAVLRRRHRVECLLVAIQEPDLHDRDHAGSR